jgi:hypothetical protein
MRARQAEGLFAAAYEDPVGDGGDQRDMKRSPAAIARPARPPELAIFLNVAALTKQKG